MSIDRRRTDIVRATVKSLVADGKHTLRPADVVDVLRAGGQPMGAWAVRLEFSNLEAEGTLVLDEDTGNYSLAESARKQGTG